MINSGEGGFLCTDDDEIAAKAICYAGCYESLIEQHLVAPPTDVFDRVKKSIPNYSLRMSDLTACCVRPQLETLEERIASGEFTKPRSSPAEDLLNGIRGLIRNVDNPQGECRNASRTKPRAHRRPAPSPLVSRLDRSIVGSIAIDAPMISSRARERKSPGESRPRRASRPASVRPPPFG